jgi:hypothetical protein
MTEYTDRLAHACRAAAEAVREIRPDNGFWVAVPVHRFISLAEAIDRTSEREPEWRAAMGEFLRALAPELGALAETGRRLRACVDHFEEANPPRHGDLRTLLAEYDRRGAENEALHALEPDLREALRVIGEQRSELAELRALVRPIEEAECPHHGPHPMTADCPTCLEERADLVELRAMRDRALAEHQATDNGQCSTCSNEDAGEAAVVCWPCPTALALGATS